MNKTSKARKDWCRPEIFQFAIYTLHFAMHESCGLGCQLSKQPPSDGLGVGKTHFPGGDINGPAADCRPFRQGTPGGSPLHLSGGGNVVNNRDRLKTVRAKNVLPQYPFGPLFADSVMHGNDYPLGDMGESLPCM